MKRPTNSGPALGISTTEPNALSWAAFDRLPRNLRKLLWGAPVAINPLSAEQLARDGDDQAHAALSGAIGDEVARFNLQHKREHGGALPTVLAEVPPMRHRDSVAVAFKAGKRAIYRRRRRR
jgi:hypothetical protein